MGCTAVKILMLGSFLALSGVTEVWAQRQPETELGRHRVDSIVTPSYSPYVTAPPLSAVLIPAQITLGMGFMMWEEDRSLRSLRHHYMGGFRTRVDDYTQFLPLAVTWGMLAVRRESRSGSLWRSVVAQSSSFAILTLITQVGKYSIGRLRPDDSSHNSFPSGHTGTAFACAAILDAEYGQDYPWLAGIGYGIATLTGMSRIANNRHWGTDVLAGASVGLSSVYLGYYLSDRIFGRKRSRLTRPFASGEASPYLLSLDNARTGLFGGIGSLSPDRPMAALGVSARVPVYKRLGTILQAKIIRAENGKRHQYLNAHALLAGASYMSPLLGGSLWWDVETTAGYLSGARLNFRPSGGVEEPEIRDYTRPSAVFKVGAGLTLVTHRTFGMRAGVGYLFAPWALPYGESEGGRNNGYEFGLSISYLLNKE